MRVELLFERDGVVFRIERSLADAALFIGGEANPVAQGNREVTARVSALLGMSYEEFLATYCTEQKGLEFLSGTKGATEREKFIIRILGYDRLEEVQELLRGDRKEKRAVLQGFEASVGSRAELEDRLAQEESRYQQVRVKHDEAVQALTKAEGDFNSLRSRMQRHEELKLRYAKEKDAVQTLQVRLEERTKRAQSLHESLIVTQDELARALKPLVGKRSFEDALRDARRESSMAKERLELLSQELQTLELGWREELSQVKAEREAVMRQVEQMTGKVSKVGALQAGGECPTCSQPLGETFEAVHSHLVKERDELLGRIDQLKSIEAGKSTPSAAVEQKREHIAEAQRNAERLRAKEAELLKCQQLEQRAEDVRKNQQSIEIEIRSAQENLDRAQQKLKECNFIEEEYVKEKGAHDAAQRLLEVARLQRVRLEGEVNTHAALVTRSKEDLERFDDRQSELEKIRREVRLFDECDRIVSDFRRYVNASIRPRMAELASEYLTDLTDGRYSAVELAEDFTPTVVEDGEAKRVISGGEEDILNLCMRIALSHMLAERAGQHFSLLLLDEVFGSLDEGRRGNVLALLEKLRRRFEQIIIITHLDDIKDGVQHLIQVEYDEGEGCARIADRPVDEFEFGIALNV
jgi:exonuclease SbcC